MTEATTQAPADIESLDSDDSTPPYGSPAVSTSSRSGTTSAPATVSRTEFDRRQSWARRRRVSKWDRDPDPNDWRFFVGTVGKILIAVGILMFGFVAYQLWGTGIETARAQARLDKQVEEKLAAIGDRDDTAGNVGNVGVVETVDPAEAVARPGDGSASTLETEAAGTAAPVAARFDPELLPTKPEVPLPPIVRGDALFVLEAPSIGLSVNVLPGVDVETLKDGPGHYPETPLPGQLGNASVAGHRTTHGAPFYDTGDIKIGDELFVTMLNGDRFVYIVSSTEVVEPTDYYIVTTRDPAVAMLTLTTCTPKYTSKQRLAIHAVLDPERSAQVTAASEPYKVAPLDGSATADDAAADPNGVDSPLVGDTEAVDAVTSADAVTAASEVATGSSVTSAAASDEELQDAFSQGWFSDRAAFPQIAFWGGVLTVIALAAYSISRQLRHDSVGFLVGIVPFLVALYFFFENVNRLLPPGL